MKTFDKNEQIVIFANEFVKKFNTWLAQTEDDVRNTFALADNFVVEQDDLTLELYFFYRNFRYLVAKFRFTPNYVFFRYSYDNVTDKQKMFETTNEINEIFVYDLPKIIAEWMKLR